MRKDGDDGDNDSRNREPEGNIGKIVSVGTGVGESIVEPCKDAGEYDGEDQLKSTDCP